MALVRIGQKEENVRVEVWNVNGNGSGRQRVVNCAGYNKITVIGGVKADTPNMLTMSLTNVTAQTGGVYNLALAYYQATPTGNTVTLTEGHNKSGVNVNATYYIILER